MRAARSPATRLGAIGRYRATGADLPFADPRPAHGVAMEGYFWRFTDPRAGRVVIALCGVCRAPDGGAWATVALGAHPGGLLREATAPHAHADTETFRLAVGDGMLAARAERLRVDLGPDAQLDLRLREVRGWPRRPYGGSGLAHALPGLGQYWHPHALGGRADGLLILGDGPPLALDGATVYAEKNWGRGGFPRWWWWGQADAFDGADVAVAFAGGEVTVGPLRVTRSALVVRLGTTVIRFGDPLLAPVRADVGDGRWALRGRAVRWSVELDATADPRAAHALPVPLPAERRSVHAALEHLAGELRLVVRRHGRIAFAGTSRLAGLEVGGALATPPARRARAAGAQAAGTSRAARA